MNPIIITATIQFALSLAALLLENAKNSGTSIDDAIKALRDAAATPLHSGAPPTTPKPPG